MFSAAILFFLISSIVPGAFFIIFNRYMKPVPNVEKDEVMRISSAILFSFCSIGVNSTLCSQLYNELSKQLTIFTDTYILLKIIIINISASFILSIAWSGFRGLILPKINNVVNKKLGRHRVTRNNMLWIDIFEDSLIGNILENCVVRVEKGGLISSGVLHAFSSHSSDRIEILLSYVSDIEKYFDFDKKQEDESKKYFSNILYEYIDLTNGYKITFYDSAKYKKLIKEHYDEVMQYI